MRLKFVLPKSVRIGIAEFSLLSSCYFLCLRISSYRSIESCIFLTVPLCCNDIIQLSMTSSPSAVSAAGEIAGQTPLILRRLGHVPFVSTPSGASGSNFPSVSQSHDELVTRLRSALKALGGRPDATTPKPTSRNRFAADELEACSRRAEPFPKMQNLDVVADDGGRGSAPEERRVSDHPRGVAVGRHAGVEHRAIEAHTALKNELEQPKKDAGVLRADIEQLTTQRAALITVEDDLRKRRSVLAEVEAGIQLSERRLNDLEGELAAKRDELDAHMSHLDRLESLANEGERIVEDQSRKASAALMELEWMEVELGRVSAELVEVTARLDEKSLMLHEASALASRSKHRAQELEGQKLLAGELERHNAAALAESKRLAREIQGLRQQKQAISFNLEPALNDALEELERTKALSSDELARERSKAERLERALQRITTDKAAARAVEAVVGIEGGSEMPDDLLRLLERERLASVKRTMVLAEGGCAWRRWRPRQQKISAHRHATR